tara:strand:+ start:2838 stop:3524 length:687 start_codon:yes stop_codon:yes gene_type:complete
MADGGTITQRITDLIGAQHTTDALYSGDLINAAINEIADMLPIDLLMKYSRTPGVLESNSEWLVEGRKILKVTRIDADSNGIERECKEVDRAGFAVAGDSNSIYNATVYSPIYHHDTANAGAATLKILPAPTVPQKGKIWYFSYVADGTDTIGMTATTLNSTYFLPSELIHAVTLKSCVNILKAYIGNQVQDEEDSELMQMIQAQTQLLEKDYLTEMQRFTGQEAQAE